MWKKEVNTEGDWPGQPEKYPLYPVEWSEENPGIPIYTAVGMQCAIGSEEFTQPIQPLRRHFRQMIPEFGAHPVDLGQQPLVSAGQCRGR